MKKIISFLLCIFLLQQAIGQTETFDIATYTVPAEWKKNAGKESVVLTSINESAGTFCLMTLHASSVSLGDAQKDFKAEWKDLVVTPFKAEADPKTESQVSDDKWNVVAGGALIKLEGADAYILLTVFSGFGKKFSVLAALNDQSYVNRIDSFLQDIKLDKMGNTNVIQTNTPGKTNATQGQFGSMLYSTPAGWNVTKYPDGDILVPADIPKGELLEIWLQPSMSFSGTLEQALQKSYDETVVQLNATKMNDVNGGNYSKVAEKKSFRGWEYIRCSGGIHMGGGEYPPEYGLDLFMIKLNDRFERIAVIKSRKNCDYSRYYPSDGIKYHNDIEHFLFSLQFADWKEPDLKKGTIHGDGITGVWQGIGLSVGAPKTGAILGAEYKVKEAIFFSNGQAYFGTKFPIEGLDELDTWVQAESNRRDWGTYTFSNGSGILKLPYDNIPLRTENNKLVITTMKTDHGYVKSNAVDGARFNGVYALSSKNFLGEETGKTPTIRLTSDGQFTDNGALNIIYHEYVDCLNPAKEPGSGTYEVKNHSFIFNYTDGRRIKIAFIGTEYDKSNPAPSTLVLSFNEDPLRKQ